MVEIQEVNANKVKKINMKPNLQIMLNRIITFILNQNLTHTAFTKNHRTQLWKEKMIIQLENKW